MSEALSETREHIRKTFAEVLRKTDVQNGTDFFAEGGTSLHAMQIIMEIESITRRLLTLEDFLLHPTPQALADYLCVLSDGNDVKATER